MRIASVDAVHARLRQVFVDLQEPATGDARHQGPGHHSVVRTPSGKWLIVYHRWENPGATEPFKGERQIAIDRVRYDANGFIQPIRMTDGAAAPTLRGR